MQEAQTQSALWSVGTNLSPNPRFEGSGCFKPVWSVCCWWAPARCLVCFSLLCGANRSPLVLFQLLPWTTFSSRSHQAAVCVCGIRGETLRLTAPPEGLDAAHIPEAFMERRRERPACGASFSQHISHIKWGSLKSERWRSACACCLKSLSLFQHSLLARLASWCTQ